jgi:hypothetical protein
LRSGVRHGLLFLNRVIFFAKDFPCHSHLALFLASW